MAEMTTPLGIIEVDHQSEDRLIVNFSDGTFAFFSAADLAALRPKRLPEDGEVAEPGQDHL
jgi:hypothetical protein